MSLTVKDNGGDFQAAPEGLHIARCYAVIDCGIQPNKAFGNSSPKVLLAWELSDCLMQDGRPFAQMQSYTSSISPKSKLKTLLEAWRGKGFTEEERKGFMLQSLLGVPCYLTTKHVSNPRNPNQPWSSIISICKLPSTVSCPPPVNTPVHFDLDNYSEEAYLKLPEGFRKKINLESVTGFSGSAPQGITGEVVTPRAAEYGDRLDIEDDCPF